VTLTRLELHLPLTSSLALPLLFLASGEPRDFSFIRRALKMHDVTGTMVQSHFYFSFTPASKRSTILEFNLTRGAYVCFPLHHENSLGSLWAYTDILCSSAMVRGSSNVRRMQMRVHVTNFSVLSYGIGILSCGWNYTRARAHRACARWDAMFTLKICRKSHRSESLSGSDTPITN